MNHFCSPPVLIPTHLDMHVHIDLFNISFVKYWGTHWKHLVGSWWRLVNALEAYRNSQETFDQSVWTLEQILNKSLGNQFGAIGNLSSGHGEVLKTSIGDP